MADETPKAPRPAKPVKKAATTATPRKAATAASKASPAAKTPKPAPKPAKPKKGPTVETTTDTATPRFKTEARAATQTLKDSASKLGKEAGDKARAYAEDGKARAGGVLDELAKMMTDAAGTVDEKVGPQYGQYARSAADAVSGFSDSIKQKNLDDLIEDARGFVKKSPAIAIGTAAAIGFVLVRLIKSGIDAADRDDA
ncbi:MAG: hypothetical protein P0Y59_03230 [Candidatus Sphingomonas phytovorans]|nr:hypothetical protein [Sphingomonas sp.]WEK00722.1 MAG: hypothetical protein P0Y59_03230 [Sphingomonas sp.]